MQDTTLNRSSYSERAGSFLRSASLAGFAAAGAAFALGIPTGVAFASPSQDEPNSAVENLIEAQPTTLPDSPPPGPDFEIFPTDPPEPPEPPNWGPDGFEQCQTDCGPGGDENGGDENGGDENGGDENGGDENGGDENGGDENGGDENGGDENGGDENGTDDGTDDGIPVPTRIDTGEGATDGSQQLWLALGGVLSALGLGTLGYRMTRSQR